MGKERGPTYWNEVITGRDAARPQTLWRAYADHINVDLCRAWWPSSTPARVLKTDMFDEASGTGLWPTLVDRSIVACGIDQSSDVIRLARLRHQGARAAAADIRRLPFRDGVFDLVISNSTLDHFERREDIATGLREINRVLTPGGRLILTLDNPVNPLVALRNALPFGLLNRLKIVPYFVGATAGPKGGRRLLADAGFRVLDVGAAMHCPRVLAVAVASILDRAAGRGPSRAFLRLLTTLEGLGEWPTRYLTGYYVAFAAEKTKSASDRSTTRAINVQTTA